MVIQATMMLLLFHIVIGAGTAESMLTTVDTQSGTNAAGLTDRCRIRRVVHSIDQPGCLARRILSFACRGGCESYSQYSDEIGGIERYCSCCQPSDEILRKVRIHSYYKS